MLFIAFPACAAANFDVFDSETMNDVSALGQEIPYTGGAPRVYTLTFDTAGFGLDPGENGASPNYDGCLDTPVVFAGKTAWVRFNPGVDGTIHVLANTPGYDSIVWIKEAREASWKTTILSDLLGHDANCSDLNDGVGSDETILPYPGGSATLARKEFVYFVQVGGKCSGGPETCTNESLPPPPGGLTTIRLTFTPIDADSDGIADSLDNCNPGGRAGFVTTDGCPDEDLDAINDKTEGPGCVGQKGVAAAAPYNGCFDGPNPPRAGGASVVIKSLTGDPYTTSTVKVNLELNWPKGAREALANNSDGLSDQRIALAAKVPWTLPASTKTRTSEVEVHFLGPGVDAKDSDSITLDPAPPTVTKTLLFKGNGGRWLVGVKATDDQGGSGMQNFAVLDSKRRPLKTRTVCKTPPCKRTLRDDVSRLKQKPKYVQVSDAAGNITRSTLHPRSQGCKYNVPLASVETMCFKVGTRCARIRDARWSEATPDPLVCHVPPRAPRSAPKVVCKKTKPLWCGNRTKQT
jgi:hypothetical protein